MDDSNKKQDQVDTNEDQTSGLTAGQIQEDTQMAPLPNSDEAAAEATNEPAESLSDDQIKEDTEMASTEDLTDDVEEVKNAPDSLTAEQIEEDSRMAAVPNISSDETEMKETPDSLTAEQIKEDTEMAPVEDPDEKLEEAKKILNQDDSVNARWFIVHTYSGHENKVAKSIKQRVQSLGFENRIFDIIVPTRNTIKVSQGKKETVKEKIFPGYVIVKMVLDDESWLLIRTTQGVTAFIGAGNKPTPISEKEVEAIMKFMNEEEPLYKTSFSIGEAVKIVDGPFSDFLGTIDNIDEAKGKLKVLVSIFGRETPVELDFLQVNKL